MNVPEPRMHQLRPSSGRVMVMESDVTEDQLASGLIVPIVSENSRYKRGVVLHVGNDIDGWEPGTVVYYGGGTTIGDVTIVQPCDIIAYFEAYA